MLFIRKFLQLCPVEGYVLHKHDTKLKSLLFSQTHFAILCYYLNIEEKSKHMKISKLY